MKKSLFTLLLCSGVVFAQQPQYYEQVSIPRELQVGLGFIPGVGVQGGYIFPIGDIMTIETIAQANLNPKSDTKAAQLDLAIGIGGGIRFMRLIDQASLGRKSDFDLDAGFRVGPKLFTKLGDDPVTTAKTAADTEVDFYIDPFIRVAKSLRNGSRAYAEGGFITKPVIRVGVITAIR